MAGHQIYSYGTQRVRDPEETLAWILPRAPLAGVTRLADVTWLDKLGIPTYQAHRPNGKSLTVWQGKGISAVHAKVSALMEAVETFHAENLQTPVQRATLAEMGSALTYRVEELDVRHPNILHEHLPIDWIPAKVITSDADTYVPREITDIDFTRSRPWPLFKASTNGLASGNTVDEALVHALCEVIERECHYEYAGDDREERWLDLDTLPDGASRDLVATFRHRADHVSAKEITDDIGVPAFFAQVWSPDHPINSGGWGCHPDPDVALSRALTEAAQSRLVMITTLRDDVDPMPYLYLRDHIFDPPPAEPREMSAWRWSETPVVEDFGQEAARLAGLIEKHTGTACLMVDLQRNDMEVPVVRVVAPGMHQLDE